MVDKKTKYADFAARLNECMKSKDLTITQLKSACGVTYEMARRYTMGTAKPRDEKMMLISKWLGVSPAYLDYGINPTNKDSTASSIQSNYQITQHQLTLLSFYESLPESEKKKVFDALQEKKQHYDNLYEELTDIHRRKII